MDVNTAIQWIKTTFDPPYVSALVGISSTLLIRAAATPAAGIGSIISARVAKYRVSTFHRELTLYKFFQRNPAVLTARVLELQSWVALCLVVFCAVWALRGPAPPIVTAVIHLVLIAISASAAWIAVNLFRLVRSVSRCEIFEASIQRRIARTKRRLASAKVALADQAEVIRQAELIRAEADLAREEQLDSGLSPEGEVSKAFPEISAKDTPQGLASPRGSARSEIGTSSKQASPDTHLPNVPVMDAVENSTIAPKDPGEPSRLDRGAFTIVQGTTADVGQAESSVSVPASPLNSTVYKSEWISGRVTRWLHRRGFGFLVSDNGEEFWAKAGANAGLQPLEEGQLVLFQAKPGSPLRKASLVCALGAFGEGRVSGLKGNVGFIAIQDSERSAGVFFRLPSGLDLGIAIDDTVGFKFGRNIIGPTANEIVAKTNRRNAQ